MVCWLREARGGILSSGRHDVAAVVWPRSAARAASRKGSSRGDGAAPESR
jgi:hypothetical protein